MNNQMTEYSTTHNQPETGNDALYSNRDYERPYVL